MLALRHPDWGLTREFGRQTVMGAAVAFRAFVFGMTIAAAIGPIALLIITTSAVDGLARGARAGLGAAVADLMFAIAAFAGGYAITTALEAHRAQLTVLASIVLVAFGLWMVVRALRLSDASGTLNGRWLRAPFLQTFALTIVNPLSIIAFMGLAVQLPGSPSLIAATTLCLCIFAGSLLVQLGLALAGSGVRRLTDQATWLRTLNILSGLGVAAFGVAGLRP
jgi:threonine/homoserine/homoserine lactone efflux protein